MSDYEDFIKRMVEVDEHYHRRMLELDWKLLKRVYFLIIISYIIAIAMPVWGETATTTGTATAAVIDTSNCVIDEEKREMTCQ